MLVLIWMILQKPTSIIPFLPRCTNALKKYTTSHIAEFISKIRDAYRYKIRLNPEYKIDYKTINLIYKSMLVPVKDIESRQDQINKWF